MRIAHFGSGALCAAILLLAFCPKAATAQDPTPEPPLVSPAQESRVETLLRKLTFDEKLEMLGGVGGFLRYRISEESAAPYEDSSAVSRAKALTTKAS